MMFMNTQRKIGVGRRLQTLVAEGAELPKDVAKHRPRIAKTWAISRIGLALLFLLTTLFRGDSSCDEHPASTVNATVSVRLTADFSINIDLDRATDAGHHEEPAQADRTHSH